MKHLLYFILAVLIVYLIGSLLMADFLWILHIGFLGWIGAIFMILWFFLQIYNEYSEYEIKQMFHFLLATFKIIPYQLHNSNHKRHFREYGQKATRNQYILARPNS